MPSPVDLSETKIDGVWIAIGIDDALATRPAALRCPECHGAMQPHRQGTTGQRAHFEHRVAHPGCTTKRRGGGGGARTRHPMPLD